MPIRPIDTMTMAPRSQEASLVKANEASRVLRTQENMEEKFATSVVKNAQKTIETMKGEKSEYRYDAKEKGNNAYSANQQKKKKKAQLKEIKPERKLSGSTFDMKI